MAHTVHLALQKSLFYRQGYNEVITALQQWLLLHIMIGQDFDIVDLFISEIEDVKIGLERRYTVSNLLPIGLVGSSLSSNRMPVWIS